MKATRQPEVNIGMVGHVDHGKTTLLETLSGKWADTHSEELKRGITIRLGYADVQVYEYPDGTKGTKEEKDGQKGKLLRLISFVDAPGHESLMATMLAGATIIDGAFLLVAASEECPQPQTREHVMALEIMGLKHLIVVQNKIDLVDEEAAKRNYQQIKAFLKGTSFENAPVIPISAQHQAGISVLLDAMEQYIPTPKRDLKKAALMLCARSFDINKPGTLPKDLVGGILGGALIAGEFKVGDTIEVRPGIEYIEKNQKEYKALQTTITAIKTGGEDVPYAHAGGSIGVMTLLDPSLVKGDSLSGSVVGHPAKMPPVWKKLTLEVHLLERVVGSAQDIQVIPVKVSEPLMLNVNSATTVGIVMEIGKNKAYCDLRLPVCADVGARVTISRMMGNRFRLIGYGIILEK